MFLSLNFESPTIASSSQPEDILHTSTQQPYNRTGSSTSRNARKPAKSSPSIARHVAFSFYFPQHTCGFSSQNSHVPTYNRNQT